jgi:hypothetical protein
MGCCGGSCSCSKNSRLPAEEDIHFVQLPISQGMLSTYDWMKGLAG